MFFSSSAFILFVRTRFLPFNDALDFVVFSYLSLNFCSEFSRISCSFLSSAMVLLRSSTLPSKIEYLFFSLVMSADKETFCCFKDAISLYFSVSKVEYLDISFFAEEISFLKEFISCKRLSISTPFNKC